MKESSYFIYHMCCLYGPYNTVLVWEIKLSVLCFLTPMVQALNFKGNFRPTVFRISLD